MANYCSKCKRNISYSEFNFSTKKFNRALCKKCSPNRLEKLAKKEAENKETDSDK